MRLGGPISENLPFLRRYARALTGSQHEGDALVRATLETAAANLNARHGPMGGPIPLYTAFTRLWQSAQARHAVDANSPYVRAGANAHLAAIPPRQREALLLMAVEQFDSAQAGQIMGMSAEAAAALANGAAADIARTVAAKVLIIEDEPLISMQLEHIVTSMGLTISGTVATREQAAQSAAACSPGLVLADVQLADGSSGLDAAADILIQAPATPVIFITAYPERLLTGDRPEPTYLLSKPFHEEAVRAAISQALFLAPPAGE